jgi:hypothetical protein
VSGTPLTENWNGRKWSSVALPNGPCSVFENSCVLTGVSGDSASDVIAVGHAILASNSGWVATAIAFHWNGSAWAPVPVPSGASSYSEFEQVKVSSPTDAWAVGNGSSGSANGVSALHWNGSGWTQVATGFATANNVTVGRDLGILADRCVGRRADGDAGLPPQAVHLVCAALRRDRVDPGGGAQQQRPVRRVRARGTTRGPSRATAPSCAGTAARGPC